MRSTPFRVLLLLAVLAPAGAVLVLTPEAAGCPFCESEIGKQVEAGIFNEDFGKNLLLTLLPFPVLIGIVALIHFGLPRPRSSAPQDPPADAGTPDDTEPPAEELT